MADIEIRVENGREVRDDLRDVESEIITAVDDGTEETAKEFHQLITDTAPVDSGTYRDDWRVEKTEDGYAIVNSVEYAKYLVWPNQNFVGSSKADDAEAGILHNVRGIIYEHRRTFRDKLKDAINRRLPF